MRSLVLLLLLASLAPAETLRVMTFNVRYPNPEDGANVWERRKDILVETVRLANPDLVGTQDLFQMQGDYVVEKLPRYRWFGIDRRGGHDDEHMGIFYRPDRLELVASGQFWLSERPDEVGSMSWDVSLPRMASWARFRTRDGREFGFVNTHFAHRRQDAAARLEMARVLRREAQRRLPADLPLVVMGDFNSSAESDVHTELTQAFEDAWVKAENPQGQAGTAHGFSGRPGEARIDWILFRGPWQVQQVRSLDFNDEGRYPSDHFPVLAVLELE